LSLGELAGYRISYGTSAGSYPYVIDISDRTVTSYTLQGPPNTIYYVVVTSIDTAGKQSANSNVVVKAL
jgi:hypothetical protein